MRKLKKADTVQESEPTYGPRPFDTLLECAIYARQSTTKQTVENRESSEAQTKDQLDKVYAIGWTDDKITLFIEGDGKRGVSGRLRIDKRTGLNALMEGIYEGRYKYVFVMNESRLFRDETMIGPDTFIDACKRHDVSVITSMYRYDFNRNPFDADQFRLQCQIAARFITDHVGFMNRMRDRVARRGQYYGGGIGIGYILDENNRPIPYEPHARIVRDMFKRYRLLNGNVARLARELNAKEYVFPPYEAGVKGPYTHLTIKNSGYGITRGGVISILTNPQYIGYWTFKGQVRRDTDGHPIINHPPIVDEADFWYVFNRLSPTTIDGEINEQREPTTRYDQEGTVPSKALLKESGILISPHGTVYCAKDRHGTKDKIFEKYSIKSKGPDYATKRKAAHFSASLLDAAFVDKMFEHLIAWKDAEEASHVGELINEEIRKEGVNNEVKATNVIDEQLAQIRPKIAHYDRLIKFGYGLDDATLEGYGTELTKLRRTEKDLEETKKSIEIEAQEKSESQELVDAALELWNEYDITQKRRVVKSVVTNVTISRVSPSWLKIEITWKGIGALLPTTDIGYLLLGGAANVNWTEEEITILREMYPHEPADAILERLPDRAWQAIISFASGRRIRREIFNTPSVRAAMHLSINDRSFMEQMDIKPEEITRGKKGYVYWSDSETMLPPSEDDTIEIDEIDGEGDLIASGKYDTTSKSS